MPGDGRTYRCPCCGWDGLDGPSYEYLPAPPLDRTVTPPYEDHYGTASYDVCVCCGFEYGFDDNPGGDTPGDSFDSFLRNWIAEGCLWFDPEQRPGDWSIEAQLVAAGIPRPNSLA